MVKMTKSAIVWIGGKLFKKKEKLGNIVLHLCSYLWAKIPVPMYDNSCNFFLNWQLMACQMAQRSETQNSKIGHLEHPMVHLYTDT